MDLSPNFELKLPEKGSKQGILQHLEWAMHSILRKSGIYVIKTEVCGRTHSLG
jgi:hypothetical protein